METRTDTSNLTGNDKLTRFRQNRDAAFGTLWAHRRQLIAGTFAIALISAGVSLVLPPRFEATTKLLPAQSSRGADLSRVLGADASILAGFTGISQSGQSSARFMALLQGRVVADRIIDQFGLMKLYGARYRHAARTLLASRTIFQEDRRTGVITITVSDRDAARAAAMAKAYVDQLEKLNAEMNTSGAKMEEEFLAQRLTEINLELKDASLRLSQFSASNSVVDVQDQGKKTVEAALQLQGQIMAAEAELSGLRAIYSESSGRVRAAQAKISELNRQLSMVKGKPEPSLTRESFPSMKELPTLGVTYAEMYRRAKLLEAVQLALTQQLEMARTEAVRQLPAFRVMEPAEVPEQRAWPKRTLIVMLSTAVGFFLLCGFTLWRHGSDWSDRDRLVALFAFPMSTKKRQARSEEEQVVSQI